MKNYGEALKCFKLICDELQPTRGMPYAYLAECYHYLGDKSEAIRNAYLAYSRNKSTERIFE